MKIAILGSRGIPVNYGGFETLAEEISARLAKRGHEVIVYCCKPYSRVAENSYKGVKRIVLPTIRTKTLEKPFFNLLSLFHVLMQKVDVALMLGVSISYSCFIPRMFGEKVAINIDGLEWQRKKWGRLIACCLRFSERMAGITADEVVTDARCIQEYYKNRYGKDTVYIAYGTDRIKYPPGETLRKIGVQSGEYILYVSRFEPENNPLLVREAYEEIENPSRKLVMVGDAPFADEYIRQVRNTRSRDIIFTGYLFGDEYKELLSNAYFYIQATEVGGTHPALLEAMGAGNCVLANDVPEHREVLGAAGVYYKGKEDLRKKMTLLMNDRRIIEEKRAETLKIVEGTYSWEKVADEYEKLFQRMLGKSN